MGDDRHGSFALREATDDDRPQILALLAAMAPHLDAQRRWSWMYRGNPEGAALTWLAVEARTGEIAGLSSYFPVRIWAAGDVVRGALGGDGYVVPRFRRRGIGAALHRMLHRQMSRHAIQVMFGAPAPANRTPLMQSGSRVIDEMVRYVRPMVASGVSRRLAFLDRISRPWLAGSRSSIVLDPVHPGDVRVDSVWRATRAELEVATIRDARFYDWRFLASPAQAQRAYVALDGHEPVGACVLERRGDALRIVDLCAPARRWPQILRAIADTARTQRCVEVAMLRSAGRRHQLWRHGYIAREGRPYLAIASEASDRADLFYQGERWTYMDADVDVDRSL
jgi:GNAT superfamily N-acetyltransferase